MALDISGTTGIKGFGRLPLSNIVPFSYRDGMTYAKLLYMIRDHVQTTFPDEMQGILNDVVTGVNAELAEMGDLVIGNKIELDNLYGTFTAQINNKLLQVIEDLEERVKWINRREISSLAYRKRVLLSLPFKFPDVNAAYAKWGVPFYPQAFQVDTTADELFINYHGEGYNLIVVYTWSTGVYKSCFGWKGGYANEGLEIKYEGSQRFMYVRYLVNGLGKFDVTVLPENLSERLPVETIDTFQGINFTYRNGVWTVTDPSSAISGEASRGSFKKLDDEFKPIGTFVVPELLAGGNPYKYRDNTMPKMQGFCDTGGGYAFSIGGFHSKGAEVNPYGYQGLRLFSANGSVIADNLMRPDLMIELLEGAGYKPTRVENEGVQMVGDKIVSFTVTSSYGTTVGNDVEGLLFMEEYADHPDAIDFTPAAVNWTAPNIDTLQFGRWPRQIDRRFYNPVDNSVMDTLPKIIDYMISVNQSEFSFYSSSVKIQDTNGIEIPAGQLVVISNANNSTFFISMYDGYREKRGTVRVDANQASGFTIASDDTGWIDVKLSAGIVPSPGATPQMRRIGGVTYLRGSVSGVNLTTGTKTVGQFNGQHAPEIKTPFIQTTEGSNIARWQIDPNGVLTIENTTHPSATTATWYPLPTTAIVSKNLQSFVTTPATV